MVAPKFQPGFRISKIDVAVLVFGAISTAVLWPMIWWVGFIIAFTVAHFFLFCNVFRISRPLELTWAAIFVVLTLGTVSFGVPSWGVTIGASLVMTATMIAIEMRKPSYHGILWQRVNPNLPQWWAEQQHGSA